MRWMNIDSSEQCPAMHGWTLLFSAREFRYPRYATIRPSRIITVLTVLQLSVAAAIVRRVPFIYLSSREYSVSVDFGLIRLWLPFFSHHLINSGHFVIVIYL